MLYMNVIHAVITVVYLYNYLGKSPLMKIFSDYLKTVAMNLHMTVVVVDK